MPDTNDFFPIPPRAAILLITRRPLPHFSQGRIMLRFVAAAFVLAVCFTGLPSARGYVEVPMTLGKVIEDSTHIALLEVTKVNREKGLVLYKKLKDLKGEFPDEPQKHNIGAGERGFHPRETK